MRVRITNSSCKSTVSYETVSRYAYEEAIEQIEKNGSLSDTVMIRLWDFYGYPDPRYVIIRELVDVVNSGIHGIAVGSYEVIASDKEDIFLKVTLKKSLL